MVFTTLVHDKLSLKYCQLRLRELMYCEYKCVCELREREPKARKPHESRSNLRFASSCDPQFQCRKLQRNRRASDPNSSIRSSICTLSLGNVQEPDTRPVGPVPRSRSSTPSRAVATRRTHAFSRASKSGLCGSFLWDFSLFVVVWSFPKDQFNFPPPTEQRR